MAHPSLQDRYTTGDLPWDLNRPDRNLVAHMERWGCPPGSALDVGAGTGENALFLASRGWEVTGLDISPTAVAMARTKGQERHLDATFLCHDILAAPPPTPPVEFAFDRGCFHIFSERQKANQVAHNIALGLKPGGIWFSLIASAEEPYRGSGPPRHRASALLAAVEPFFSLISLETGRMDSNRPQQMRIFKGLFQRRETFLE